jgi:hypothetical protein
MSSDPEPTGADSAPVIIDLLESKRLMIGDKSP